MVPTKLLQQSTKWEQDVGNINVAEMRLYHSVIPSLKEVKLRDFQYKIKNKILVTKSLLYRINKVADNLC